MNEHVLIERDGGVAHVRLNRPDKRNALDGAMFRAIAGAGAALRDEPGLRAVVLSGDGPSFCAGLDLTMFAALDDTSADGNPGVLQPGGVAHLGQQIAWAWQEVPVPVVAAVHGHALGGGLQLALGADIRIVHPDAQLSAREAYWGLVPDMAGTLFLSRLTRPDVVKELIFTARILDGREALQLGLATRLSDDPVADALALALEIAGRSPDAVRAAKRLCNRLADAGFAEQFAAERDEIARLVGSRNQREAVTAHLERRRPEFTEPR